MERDIRDIFVNITPFYFKVSRIKCHADVADFGKNYVQKGGVTCHVTSKFCP